MGRPWGWPLDRWFEDVFETLGEGRLPELWSQGQFVPSIDVVEGSDSLTLTAEVPGMTKDDIEVTVDNGVLALRGEKKEEKTTEEAGYHRVERRYGQFERRIRLPQYVDANKIKATYKDGVLKLTMPKAEAAKTKAIRIEGE